MRLPTAIILAALLASGSAMGQTGVATENPDGSCYCSHMYTFKVNMWPCRHAIDYSTPIQCNANLNLKLVCPENKAELCNYVNQPTCTEPRTIAVCYSADEPKD